MRVCVCARVCVRARSVAELNKEHIQKAKKSLMCVFLCVLICVFVCVLICVFVCVLICGLQAKKSGASLHVSLYVSSSMLREKGNFLSLSTCSRNTLCSPPWSARVSESKVCALTGTSGHTFSPYTRHNIAQKNASSSPNMVTRCCSNAGTGRFFVSASATILLVLYCCCLTSLSLRWSTK